jgi:hypothetical protein
MSKIEVYYFSGTDLSKNWKILAQNIFLLFVHVEVLRILTDFRL